MSLYHGVVQAMLCIFDTDLCLIIITIKTVIYVDKTIAKYIYTDLHIRAILFSRLWHYKKRVSIKKIITANFHS